MLLHHITLQVKTKNNNNDNINNNNNIKTTTTTKNMSSHCKVQIALEKVDQELGHSAVEFMHFNKARNTTGYLFYALGKVQIWRYIN